MPPPPPPSPPPRDVRFSQPFLVAAVPTRLTLLGLPRDRHQHVRFVPRQTASCAGGVVSPNGNALDEEHTLTLRLDAVGEYVLLAASGEYCGLVGEYCGLVGEYCGLVGEY